MITRFHTCQNFTKHSNISTTTEVTFLKNTVKKWQTFLKTCGYHTHTHTNKQTNKQMAYLKIDIKYKCSMHTRVIWELEN
jgi:hypothetical protein